MVLDLAIDCGNAMHVFPEKSDSVISMCNINKSYPNLFSNNNLNSQNIYTECNNSTAENTEDYQNNNLNCNKEGVKKTNNNEKKINNSMENNVNCRNNRINIGIQKLISKHVSDTKLNNTPGVCFTDDTEASSYAKSAMNLVTMSPVRNKIDDMSQNTTLMTLNTDGILEKDISEKDNSILLIQDEKNDNNIRLRKIGNNNTRQLNNIFKYFRDSTVLAKLRHKLLNNAKGKNNSVKKIIKKNVNSKLKQNDNTEDIKEVKNPVDVKLVHYINNDIDRNDNIVPESAQYDNDNIKDSINANIKTSDSRNIKLPAYVNNDIDKNSRNFKTIMFHQLTNKISEKLCHNQFKEWADKAIEAQNKQEIKQIVNKIKDNKYKEKIKKMMKEQMMSEIKDIVANRTLKILAQENFNELAPRYITEMFHVIKEDNKYIIGLKSFLKYIKSFLRDETDDKYKVEVEPVFQMFNFRIKKRLNDLYNYFYSTRNEEYLCKCFWYEMCYEPFDDNTIMNFITCHKKTKDLCLSLLLQLLSVALNEEKNLDILSYNKEIQDYINYSGIRIDEEKENSIKNMIEYFTHTLIISNKDDSITKNKIEEMFGNPKTFGSIDISYPSKRYDIKEDENGKKYSEGKNIARSYISTIVEIYNEWKNIYDKYNALYNSLAKREQLYTKIALSQLNLEKQKQDYAHSQVSQLELKLQKQGYADLIKSRKK